ncbi:DNA damage response protein WSS1 [Wickerhamomyces ciferrii]|uniref:DNA damage response protein WSS1 n=1 Tax=Wickerhamomyces ciferrii (strain ATCC 14091 / BCRC 22168 / CBS 111 / JCM 3599 / NBRC 0793 / NRRL Y-1031 F-60-10) TaxID=1206466 RepID=K0KRB0_WICCF|nr:DNA damage response protein WSS1 [Wickerhamomyces ciferrii]CCH45691.1 DNA damage response protein WSS1 [Wickerhamomyces ciferrii]
MVVKGRFSRKAPPPEITIPKLFNKNIHNIAALKRKPRQQDALNILYEIANLVTPIMKEYGFTVKNLCEFFPKTDNLLGMNMNAGYKIFIRLRPPFNENVFLPMNELIGTMLHELTHNKHGPHDAKFYKLLDELTNKQEIIMIKGGPVFEQDPFAGLGKQLGGNNPSNIRDARLKRLDIKYVGSVQKLGGDDNNGKPKTQQELKDLVRQAAIKRYEDNKWCHDAVKGDLPQDDELDIIVIDSDNDNESENENNDNANPKLKRRHIEKLKSNQIITSKSSPKLPPKPISTKMNGKEDDNEIIILDSDDDSGTKLSEESATNSSKPTDEHEELIDLTED